MQNKKIKEPKPNIICKDCIWYNEDKKPKYDTRCKFCGWYGCEMKEIK